MNPILFPPITPCIHTELFRRDFKNIETLTNAIGSIVGLGSRYYNEYIKRLPFTNKIDQPTLNIFKTYYASRSG